MCATNTMHRVNIGEGQTYGTKSHQLKQEKNVKILKKIKKIKWTPYSFKKAQNPVKLGHITLKGGKKRTKPYKFRRFAFASPVQAILTPTTINRRCETVF